MINSNQILTTNRSQIVGVYDLFSGALENQWSIEYVKDRWGGTNPNNNYILDKIKIYKSGHHNHPLMITNNSIILCDLK